MGGTVGLSSEVHDNNGYLVAQHQRFKFPDSNIFSVVRKSKRSLEIELCLYCYMVVRKRR